MEYSSDQSRIRRKGRHVSERRASTILPDNVLIFEWEPGLEIDAIEQDDAKNILDDVNVQADFCHQCQFPI